MVTRAFRIIGVALLAGMLVTIVHNGIRVATAQSPRGADSSEAAVSALVAEVRGLRAELSSASQRGLRFQLLMGRIQMQEQRLAYLDRQRSEVTAKLSDHTTGVERLRNQVQGFGAGCNIPDRNECENALRGVKQELATQEAAEQRLRAQESDLVNAITTEQGRWSDFNSRLDDLERELASR